MAGYLCQVCDQEEPAVELHTSLTTGGTLAICGDCLPVALIGRLAGILEMDHAQLYESIYQLAHGSPETAPPESPAVGRLTGDESPVPAGEKHSSAQRTRKAAK